MATATPTINAAGNITSVAVVDAGSGYSSATASLVKPGNVTINSANVSGSSGSNVITITSSTSGIYAGMQIAATGVNTSARVTTVNSGNVIVSLVNTNTVSGNAVFYDAGTGVPGAVTLAYYATDVSKAFSISANVNGSNSLQGDILKQEASRRFRIRTTDGTAVCKLSNTAPQIGEVRITAIDSDNGTYYIDKLTSRTALITRGTGTQFATGARVPWNTVAAVASTSIQIVMV